MKPFVDLKSQYQSIKDEIQRAIDDVFDRGRFILGEKVEAFEKEFASYCGCRYGIGVGSGTEALHLSLIACGVGHGDQVITVPNTAVPTVSAVTFAGASPLFVDIDTKTYTMDPNRLEALLKKQLKTKNSKPKAIIPVHLYGHPADMDPIIEIARRYELAIIEDACQAHGAEYKGRKIGSLGDTGCFSFYPTKNLSAYGDGGMVVTNSSAMAKHLRQLRNYGQKDRYHSFIKGFNSRLDEIHAAVLLVKLKYLDKWNQKRRKMADLYDRSLISEKIVKPVEANFSKHVYHLYVIRCKEREGLQRYLVSKGIETLIHYPIPIHLQPAYKDLGLKKGVLPVSEGFSKEILSLPIFPELKAEDIEETCELINRF